MSFTRACVYDQGLERIARAGDYQLLNPVVTVNATAGNQSITIPMMSGGVGVFTGAAGAVQYTIPVAADIIAAFPQMDIGDSFMFSITNTAAQIATLNTAAAGVTYSGFTTANAQTRTGIITKTSATAVNCVWI
jgi:hypothetical protein